MNRHALKRLLLLGSILLATVLAASAASGEDQDLEPAPADKPAPKPRNPALVEVADVPGLPRVLLLGDSISMGYTLPVRKKLEGIANVHRPLENCGDTARGLVHLDAWLGKGHWDVIHFNFGLHDLKYLNARGRLASQEDGGRQVASPEVYARRLRELTLRLKATGATLIFATTTPVPPGAEGRVAGDEVRYNQAALAVMKELGVGTDDLWAYVSGRQQKTPPADGTATASRKEPTRRGGLQLPSNVHFTKGGYNQLATVVAASIRKALKPAP